MTEANGVSVEPVVNGYKVTAHFSRKKSDGDYGSQEASVWVEGTIGPDSTAEEIAEEAARLFLPARTAVYDELNVETYQDENGFLRESVTPYASKVEATAKVVRAFPGTTVDRPTPRGGISKYDQALGEWVSFDAPDWLVKQAAEQKVDRVFENKKKGDETYVYYTAAGKNPPKQPDGKPWAFWPPKD